jgi:hypothetical protein
MNKSRRVCFLPINLELPKILFCLILLLCTASAAFGQDDEKKTFAESYKKGYVFDERLSALRKEPDVMGPIRQRLRRGRSLYLLESHRDRNGVLYYRVAVTRRTRGWVQAAAVAFPSQRGDDSKVLALAEATSDVERLSICKVLIEHFPASSLRPKALLLFGEEAEDVASKVLKRAGRRMSDEDKLIEGVPKRYYYLNDVGLDRYNRLGVRFDYDEKSDEYVYAGDSYREIIRKYPKSDVSAKAREHLNKIEAKLSTNQSQGSRGKQ